MNKFPKKLTALILLCAMLVTALASCTIQPGYEGAPQGMRPCNEGENGAILYVPSYWNVNDSTGVPSAYYSDRDYSMITMITVPAEEVAGRSVPEYWESYKTSFTSSVSDFAITKSAETDHCRKNHVYSVSCDEVAYRFHAGEHLYEMRLQGFSHFFIFRLVADDYIIGPEFESLTDKQCAVVVGSEKFHVEKVPVLAHYIQSLPAYGTSRTEYCYPSLFHPVRN